MVVFGQKYWYLCKRDCIRAKDVVSGQKLLYSGKVVILRQSGCIGAKVVVFGQSGFIPAKWFYSCKTGCIL